MRHYSALTLEPLAAAAVVCEPQAPGRVGLDDPAFAVMTDLRDAIAATTTADTPMDRAHAAMIQRGVRLLFVLDASARIVGVITATDLLGEKPMRFMQSHGAAHSDITVGDLLTPASMLEAIPMQDVSQMSVGHIVATLKSVGRQHLMVSEDGGGRVRGLFSASQVARQLGMEVQTFEVASSFAEVEAALVR